jgi:hypothetical protein
MASELVDNDQATRFWSTTRARNIMEQSDCDCSPDHALNWSSPRWLIGLEYLYNFFLFPYGLVGRKHQPREKVLLNVQHAGVFVLWEQAEQPARNIGDPYHFFL